MKVYMRLYTRHDKDLIAIHASGVNLGKCLQTVLQAYARGRTVRLDLAVPPARDVSSAVASDARYLYIRVSIQDEPSIAVLKTVRNKCRNAFCKTLLRNSIAFPSYSMFFASPSDASREEERCRQAAADSRKTGVLIHPDDLIPVPGGHAETLSETSGRKKPEKAMPSRPEAARKGGDAAEARVPALQDDPPVSSSRILPARLDTSKQKSEEGKGPETESTASLQDQKGALEQQPEEFVDLDGDSTGDLESGQSIMEAFNQLLGQV